MIHRCQTHASAHSPVHEDDGGPSSFSLWSCVLQPQAIEDLGGHAHAVGGRAGGDCGDRE